MAGFRWFKVVSAGFRSFLVFVSKLSNTFLKKNVANQCTGFYMTSASVMKGSM